MEHRGAETAHGR